jgi:hypothetical protein
VNLYEELKSLRDTSFDWNGSLIVVSALSSFDDQLACLGAVFVL